MTTIDDYQANIDWNQHQADHYLNMARNVLKDQHLIDVAVRKSAYHADQVNVWTAKRDEFAAVQASAEQEVNFKKGTE